MCGGALSAIWDGQPSVATAVAVPRYCCRRWGQWWFVERPLTLLFTTRILRSNELAHSLAVHVLVVVVPLALAITASRYERDNLSLRQVVSSALTLCFARRPTVSMVVILLHFVVFYLNLINSSTNSIKTL